MIGDNESSKSFVAIKKKTCEKLEIPYEYYHFDENIEEHFISQEIKKLNENEDIHGIMIQVQAFFKLVACASEI